jgi:hypothetical protein
LYRSKPCQCSEGGLYRSKPCRGRKAGLYRSRPCGGRKGGLYRSKPCRGRKVALPTPTSRRLATAKRGSAAHPGGRRALSCPPPYPARSPTNPITHVILGSSRRVLEFLHWVSGHCCTPWLLPGARQSLPRVPKKCSRFLFWGLGAKPRFNGSCQERGKPYNVGLGIAVGFYGFKLSGRAAAPLPPHPRSPANPTCMIGYGVGFRRFGS